MPCSPEHNSLFCSERRFLLKAVVSYSIDNLTSLVCVQAGGRWQVAGGRGKQTFSLLWVRPGGEGHSIIWPIWVCAAEQGMVFRLLRLKQGVFLDRKP